NAEGALGGGALDDLGRDRTFPVLGLEAADDLAGPTSHRVAVLAEGADVDLLRELGHLGARHADTEVRAADAEPLLPRLVDHLRLAGQHPVDPDVLRAGELPPPPRQRVPVRQ